TVQVCYAPNPKLQAPEKLHEPSSMKLLPGSRSSLSPSEGVRVGVRGPLFRRGSRKQCAPKVRGGLSIMPVFCGAWDLMFLWSLEACSRFIGVGIWSFLILFSSPAPLAASAPRRGVQQPSAQPARVGSSRAPATPLRRVGPLQAG